MFEKIFTKKIGKKKNSDDKEVGLFAIFIILSISSSWTCCILFSISLLINEFLQIFALPTSHLLYLLYKTFPIILSPIFLLGLFFLFSLLSEKYVGETVALSLYITFLLLTPIIWLTVAFIILLPEIKINLMVEVMVGFIGAVSMLLFSIFFLLRLCSKHPVLDMLSLIFLGTTALLLFIFLLIFIIFTDAKQIDWLYNISIFSLVVSLFVMFIGVFWKLLKIIERSLFIWEDVNQTEKNVTLVSKKEEYNPKENKGKHYIYKKLIDYLLDTPNVRLVNKIYLLTIFTLTLFTLGTIFIAGFTHVEDYKQLENATNKNMSAICNLHSENSINAINETLTVKSDSEKHNYTLTLSSLCKQYEQDRKDFVTYFSALIGAVITFFVAMYDRFIRKRGEEEKEKKEENTKKDESQK